MFEDIVWTVYSKDNCSFCTSAKMLLEREALQYNEVLIGRDMTREEFMEKFPNQKTLPLIFDASTRVGGFTELKNYLKD